MVRNVTRTFIDAMAFCFAVWPVLREGGREKREGKYLHPSAPLGARKRRR